MDWKNKLYNIQNKVKFQLHAKKIDDLESLHTLIEECDTDRSGYLDKDEFLKFLSRLGVFLTTQELRCVFDAYDTNKDKRICYSEFVQLIRNTMSERRLALVKHAFHFLDVDGARILPLSLLNKSFKAEAHPRVRSRQKTAQQVRQEFERSIVKKSKDGVHISEDEFLEYYADINATLPSENEEYFVDVIISTWGVTASESYVSPERLAELETIIFEKIRQKTFSKEDEGKTVKKAFQYFDLEGKGVVEIKQFAAALRKFGCVFSDVEIAALFQKYDFDQSGKLAYDEFCAIFALKGAGVNPNVNPVFKLSREPPYEVLERIKNGLKKNGLTGVTVLSRLFRKADKNKSLTLCRSEFCWVLKEAGFHLTKNEFDNIFRYFDKNCDDEISYKEFMGYIRGELNERRLNVVGQAFKRLDKAGDGRISLEEMRLCYDVSNHPELKLGKRPDEILKEFMSNWEIKKDGVISWEEFLEHYKNISATVECDDEFEGLLKNEWKIK